jgi:hypothetical protein
MEHTQSDSPKRQREVLTKTLEGSDTCASCGGYIGGNIAGWNHPSDHAPNCPEVHEIIHEGENEMPVMLSYRVYDCSENRLTCPQLIGCCFLHWPAEALTVEILRIPLV